MPLLTYCEDNTSRLSLGIYVSLLDKVKPRQCNCISH